MSDVGSLTNCPTCASTVSVQTSDEGTSHYVPDQLALWVLSILDSTLEPRLKCDTIRAYLKSVKGLA